MCVQSTRPEARGLGGLFASWNSPGPLGASKKAILGHLGAILSHLGANLACLGTNFGYLGANMDQLSVKCGPKTPSSLIFASNSVDFSSSEP